MTPLKAPIETILKMWNENSEKVGNTTSYSIEVKNRKKKYYINIKDFYELEICELIFVAKEQKEKVLEVDGVEKYTEDILLYRKELQVPKKVKNVPKYEVINNYEDQLYKYFLYECIGVFGITCLQTIKNQDYSSYDLDKDRIVGHPSFKDTVIETLEDGSFYKAGDQFDVFNQLDGGWAVYTQHDIGKVNNGLAKIDGNKCKVVKETAQKIELLESKSKLIL